MRISFCRERSAYSAKKGPVKPTFTSPTSLMKDPHYVTHSGRSSIVNQQHLPSKSIQHPIPGSSKALTEHYPSTTQLASKPAGVITSANTVVNNTLSEVVCLNTCENNTMMNIHTKICLNLLIYSLQISDLLSHLQSGHHYPVEVEKLKFPDFTAFVSWKTKEETMTHSSYVQQCAPRTYSDETHWYRASELKDKNTRNLQDWGKMHCTY